LCSLNNLAYSYNNIGEYEKALGLYEKAYGQSCKVLGEEHPHTVEIKESLEELRSKM
jgi:tetratricopeptide (TPR) repeat protein